LCITGEVDMPDNVAWGSVHGGVRERVELFLGAAKKAPGDTMLSAYLTGASSRGEYSTANPEIDLLLVFPAVGRELLDHLAALGRKYGGKGLHAPMLLTPEYLKNACDVFPLELFELMSSHVLIQGEDLLSGVSISDTHLRLQCERELRWWRLQLRNGYLKAAGDRGWLAGWFIDASPRLFKVMRAVLHLMGGNTNAGNTVVAERLKAASGVDMSAVVELWELRKAGKKPAKDKVFGYFERWDAALETLVEKVDAIG